MAIKTSNGSGPWSTGGTWVGGVAPVSGDSFVIAAGHTVTFDVDQSGMATGMIAGTITGTLAITTTPGTYILKMDGVSGHDITLNNAASKLDWGTRASPIAVGVNGKINLGASSRITTSVNSATINLWATWPTHRETLTTGTNSAGASSITVADTWATLNADQWSTGDILCIVKRQTAAVPSTTTYEFVTVAAGSSGSTIKISGTLANTYTASSWVVRVTSNIMVVCSGTITTGGLVYGQSKSITSNVGCTLYKTGTQGNVGMSQAAGTGDNAPACFNCSSGMSDFYQSQSGAYFVACATGVHYSNYPIINHRFLGCQNAIGNTSGFIYVDPTSYFGGCGVVSSGGSLMFAGVVESCQAYMKYGSTIQGDGIILREAKIGGSGIAANNADVQPGLSKLIQGYGAGLFSGTQVANYVGVDNNGGAGNPFSGVVLWDYAATYDTPQPGYIFAWLKGGRIDTVTSGQPASPPVTLSYWYRNRHETTISYLVMEIPITCIANQPLTVTIWAAKDTNSMSATPRFSLAEKQYPFGHASSEITGATMTDNTSWQTFTLQYTPTYNKQIVLRVQGRNTATASLWWNYQISDKPFFLSSGMKAGLNG